MENRCNANARINRIGNGFNGHTGNYQCKLAATTAADYKIQDAGSWELIGIESLPTCSKHATAGSSFRRYLKREVKAVR